jgi:hypothetical protein
VPARLAGICGLLAFVTVNVGWIAGSLAQPSSFSTADDDIHRCRHAPRAAAARLRLPAHPLVARLVAADLAAIPAIIAANVVFSTIGDGAASRAGTVVVFLWIAFVGARLLEKGDRVLAGETV